MSVLLIASDQLDVALVGEAFEEISELKYRKHWRGFALTLVEGLEEAEQFLASRGVDAVMLCLSAMDDPLPAYRRVTKAAPGAAVVVLADPDQEQIALDLVRLGAQDYLLLSEVDCEPLAHAVRCSIERKRLADSQERLALMDTLTGLYNERGLSHFLEHYAKLAARHGLRLLRVEAGLPEKMATNQDDIDLAALTVSDAVRGAFEPTDIVARTGPTTFSVVALVSGADEAAATVNRLTSLLPEGAEVRAKTTVTAVTAS